MSVHRVHPRSTFQKQFRTRSLRQQKAKRTFPFSPHRGSAQRFVQRFCAATHPFLRNSLCRGRETAIQPRFRAAIHLFKRKSLYRDSRIQEKQWHDAATHPFPRNSVCRERETTNRSQHTKKQPPPHKKKSARIGNDRCRHFSYDGP